MAHIQEEYKIIHVRSGQPRPYADTEYVTRVEHWTYDWRGEEGHIYDPTETKWVNEQRSEQEIVDDYNESLLEKALVILDYKSYFRTHDKVNYGSMDDYFSGWFEVTYPQRGVVEITRVSPYND